MQSSISSIAVNLSAAPSAPNCFSTRRLQRRESKSTLNVLLIQWPNGIRSMTSELLRVWPPCLRNQLQVGGNQPCGLQARAAPCATVHVRESHFPASCQQLTEKCEQKHSNFQHKRRWDDPRCGVHFPPKRPKAPADRRRNSLAVILQIGERRLAGTEPVEHVQVTAHRLLLCRVANQLHIPLAAGHHCLEE